MASTKSVDEMGLPRTGPAYLDNRVPRRTERLSYDEIEALAVRCEREGGYARRTGGPDGTELHIGETVLTGEDALEFVIRLNQRLVSRGTGKLDEQSYRQGRGDMLREVQETIGGLG